MVKDIINEVIDDIVNDIIASSEMTQIYDNDIISDDFVISDETVMGG